MVCAYIFSSSSIRSVNEIKAMWKYNTALSLNETKRAICQRFVNRLHLPTSSIIHITRLDENINKRTYNNNIFTKFFGIFQKKPLLLQLYHSTRYVSEDKIQSIFQNGLFPGSACNKGYGVYLSSHSRYSYLWGDSKWDRQNDIFVKHVFICNVIGKQSSMNKYISEIYSPKNNWEYVVSDHDIVYPKYYMEYFVTPQDCIKSERGWTNATCPACLAQNEHIEICFRRCDCEQHPTIDPEDIIVS